MSTELKSTEAENVAQTMRDVIEKLGHHADVALPSHDTIVTPHIVTVPTGRSVRDLTAMHREAAQYLKPHRRKGTATLTDLDSFIAWANRFKSAESVLFANAQMAAPSLTCIANYHGAGGAPTSPDEPDPTAQHCDHRAIYKFPLSDEWRAWMAVAGEALTKDQMGEFIENNARDVQDPTPAIINGKVADENQSWENRLIETSQKIEGRFGQLTQLLQISKRFEIYESNSIKLVSNRDTGEKEIQFLNEHKDADGAPMQIPNLIIIAIPVFVGGPLYRLCVRLRYRAAGGGVTFSITPYNADKAFRASLEESVAIATEATAMPTFMGAPEQ